MWLWEGNFRAHISGPEIRALETALKEQNDCVSDLRVSVSRPSARFDVYVKDAQGDELFELMKTIADYINQEQLYASVLVPEFRPPYIWADGITITFYQGWGPFAQEVQKYSCFHDAIHYSYGEIAEMGFHQWKLRSDVLDADRVLPEVVYQSGTAANITIPNRSSADLSCHQEVSP